MLEQGPKDDSGDQRRLLEISEPGQLSELTHVQEGGFHENWTCWTLLR